MKPVWSWLHYISPSRYTYEALLTNEFHRLNIACHGDLIPQTTAAIVTNQICTIRGAKVGQSAVPGLQYVESFGFNYSNRWRNVGILLAFTVVYVLVGVVGSEIMHFTPQGGNPVVFASQREDSQLEKDRGKTADVEKSAAAGTGDLGTNTGPSLVWKDLSVDIEEKSILKGISGYVRPGELTALCGASGAGKTTLLSHLSRTNAVGKLGGRLEFGNQPLGKYFKKVAGNIELHNFFMNVFMNTH